MAKSWITNLVINMIKKTGNVDYAMAKSIKLKKNIFTYENIDEKASI